MNEQQLILYYYNDGLSEAERREIKAAFASDEGLQKRYEALARDLDTFSEPGDVPLPEGFEYRLHSSLARAARLEESEDRRGSWMHGLLSPRFLAAGTALATVLAVGVGIGVWLAGDQAPQPQIVLQAQAVDTPEWSQTAFQRGLQSHFRTGRANLETLSPDSYPDQQSLITSLIAQNRLYEELAIQNDVPEVARVLRSFEATLLQLAGEDLSPQEMSELKAKLEFEFSVMLTKLARQTSQQTDTPNQEI